MYKKTVIISLLCCIFLSCENETLSYFPYAPVSFEISLMSDEHGTLTQPGGFYVKRKKLERERVGYRDRGVLVYRTYQGDEFRAFDITCSSCFPTGTIAVSNGHIVKCTNSACNSEYNLEAFGSAVSGLAKERGRRLQPYKATLVGNDVIVRN